MHFELPILEDFLNATPTAELEPITEDYVQSDEADVRLISSVQGWNWTNKSNQMGFTYAELSIFGVLRKEQKLGPYGAFSKLVHDWKDKYTPREIADKVKRFYHYYAINRHKMTTS